MKSQADLGAGTAPAPTPTPYRWLDISSECLIYLQVIFAPWLFGSTDVPTARLMSWGGYLLGLLLVAKWIYRLATGFKPGRWRLFPDGEPARWDAVLTWIMAMLSVGFLAFCLTGALNPRAAFFQNEMRFEYYNAVPWLPQTYDKFLTWEALFQYGGLACFFWGLRDWILTARRADWNEHKANRDQVPERVCRLLWVLCVNGAILAIESILQRLSGTNKLLWLDVPMINNVASAQFGPYPYRSNGAQYFNLLWPVCLGFWHWLGKQAKSSVHSSRMGGDPRIFLIPCAVVMAIAPIISSSRGGALVLALELVGAGTVLLAAYRERGWIARLGIISLFVLILAAGGSLGWEELNKRFKEGWEKDNRAEIYANANRIVNDYPMYGTGLGSFSSVYQLYLKDPSQVWHDTAHDDWLETRATTGVVGFSMLLGVLLLLFLHWFGRGGMDMPWEMNALAWVGLAGCLAHATFDFPLQVYSILCLFILLSCLVFSGSKPPR